MVVGVMVWWLVLTFVAMCVVVVVIVVIDGGGRVQGCGLRLWRFVSHTVCFPHGLFPTRAGGIIYFLNNHYPLCPVSSAGYCVVILLPIGSELPKGSGFDSRSDHLFSFMISFC